MTTVERTPSSHPRGLQPGRRRSRTTTSSRPTASWSRRCAARAATGPSDRVSEVGAFAGSARAIRWGVEANENPPKLRTHDRFGNRIDEVEFHPAWHELLGAGVAHGAACAALARAAARRPRRPGRDVHRLAGRGGRRLPDLDDLLGDPGAAQAARARGRVGAALHVALTTTASCDPAPDKPGALCGMGMTEKQGGSDVRANTTTATAAQRRRPRRRVRDHRPQVVLVGADVRRVPRPRPGRRRALLLPDAALHSRRRAQRDPHPAAQGQARQPLQRLERGRVPRRLGADGRRGGPRRADDHRDGQPHPARLRLGAAAGMRVGVAKAIHHASQRSAFGKLLIDQPLMQNVLADLAIESEAATIASMRLARAYDEAIAGDEQATQFKRARQRGAQVLALQARARRTRSRRSSASAATATSRSRGCRGSTARRR